MPRNSCRATGGEREDPKRQNPRGAEYRRAARRRTLPSSCEARLIAVGVEPRGGVVQVSECAQPEGMTRMREPKLQSKSHVIPMELVRDAWAKVKEKGGAAGPDGVTVPQFEETADDRLYVLWNRMSSGSYFPGPVRAVEIPKKGKKGGVRVLGIPNVIDRVAQTVIKLALEPLVEPVFHRDSYGYRPGRSPEDALRVCRQRCWRYDWVVDLDVKAFFDTVPWDLMLKAVAHHTDSKWVLLYVERCLKSPMRKADGTLVERTRGTPQGGPLTPPTHLATRRPITLRI